MNYQELIEKAQVFKEYVWAFLEKPGITEAEAEVLKGKVNDVLDSIDELPFES